MSTRSTLFLTLLSVGAVASPAFAQPEPTPAPAPTPSPEPTPTPTPTPAPDPMPPHDMAKMEPAMPAPVEPKKDEKKDDKPPVTSKWSTSLYGFVEFDSILDSTQGFNDLAGNSAIAKPGYTGDHPQLTFGARNSRIGFKLGAPETNGIKATAQLEMDFLGNQPSPVSEAAFWQNPTMRFRHFNLKMETDYVDILLGQSWQLFGWQSAFHPNTVEIQGVPGQVYSRAPQIRFGKTIKSDAVNVELAIAAVRPVARAGFLPDAEAGAKLVINKWKAHHTAGSAGSSTDGAAIGVSVIGRRFAVNEFSATPHSEVKKNGGGVSIDALIPLIAPADKDHYENSLTLTGSFVHGRGIADMYTSLSGGVSQAALPNPDMTNPAPAYTPNIDNALAIFTADGVLHAVEWQSYMVGLQYYLPPSGKVFVSANYSHMNSNNAHALGGAGKVWDTSDWADGNLMMDLTPAVRLGLEYAYFHQKYTDGVGATDHRVQFSGFFIF